jgi:hypothetical protein
MADLNKERVCITFCFKLDENATKTFNMLKVAFEQKKVGRTHKLWGDFQSSKTERQVCSDVKSILFLSFSPLP